MVGESILMCVKHIHWVIKTCSIRSAKNGLCFGNHKHEYYSVHYGFSILKNMGFGTSTIDFENKKYGFWDVDYGLGYRNYGSREQNYFGGLSW